MNHSTDFPPQFHQKFHSLTSLSYRGRNKTTAGFSTSLTGHSGPKIPKLRDATSSPGIPHVPHLSRIHELPNALGSKNLLENHGIVERHQFLSFGSLGTGTTFQSAGHEPSFDSASWSLHAGDEVQKPTSHFMDPATDKSLKPRPLTRFLYIQGE
ncbi:hypothetical protein B0H10DRAFT_1940448 [Mycena sp. CBHHK59/15]|nr:hypothetical protein B0H10DRAFT_1940448 [Mycena sp. CBHHK59/15]